MQERSLEFDFGVWGGTDFERHLAVVFETNRAGRNEMNAMFYTWVYDNEVD